MTFVGESTWTTQESGARVLQLKLSRPDRFNALGPSIVAELLAKVQEVKARSDIKALVLTAETVEGKSPIWLAGGDLKELAEFRTPEDILHYSYSVQKIMETLDELMIPVVTVIDGWAIGGGAELALAGDLRVATDRSYLDFRQLKVGLPLGYGSTRRLVKLMGLADAQRAVYTAAKLSAQEAYTKGLIHVVCPPRELENALTNLLENITSIDPQAFKAQKKLFWALEHTHPGARAYSKEIFAGAWRNPAHEKSLRSYHPSGGAAR